MDAREDQRGPLRRGCADFLRRTLATRQSTPASEVLAPAQAEGIEADPKTWFNARGDAGVCSEGAGAGAVWFRSDAAAPPADADDPLFH